MIWPWSKFKRLQNEIADKYDFQQALVHYLDKITSYRHMAMGNKLYIFKNDETWVMEKTS